MRAGLRRSIHSANVALAVIFPITLVGAIVLRNASEAVLQLFALVCLFAVFALFYGLDVRSGRREKRDQ